MRTMQSGLAVLVAATALAACLLSAGCSGPDEDTVVLYAGAGLRNAINPAIEAFEKKHGIKVVVDYAGSGTILATAKEKRLGDLFMPGDVWYVEELDRQAGLIVDETKTPVAYFVPVILVRKGNPKGIKTLADLFGADVRVALGSAQACQIGRLSTKLLAKNGLDRAKLTPMESLTVNELGVWVDTRKVDAAIVWDATAANYATSCQAIPIPTEKNIISRVVVGLMTTSSQPDKARKFIEFLTSKPGQAILNAHGLQTEAP